MNGHKWGGAPLHCIVCTTPYGMGEECHGPVVQPQRVIQATCHKSLRERAKEYRHSLILTPNEDYHADKAYTAGALAEREEILRMMSNCGHEAPANVRFAVQDIAYWLEARMKEREK